MKKILLSSKKYGEMASFEYDNDELLKELRILASLQKSQINVIAANCTTPTDLAMLVEFIQKKDSTAIIEEIAENLSFERFWEEYNHKVGKKAQVQKKWESMPDTEKAKALKHIKKYNFFLAERPNIERKYPQTYLNAQEWNN